MKTILSNQKGFGLIEALVALVISSIAMVGLFLGSNYAKAKAVENYHYRRALLKASEIMENIKHNNRHSKLEPILGNYSQNFVLDERNGNKLMADVSVSKNNTTDFSISTSTSYSTIIVSIDWEESFKLKPNSLEGIERSISIREDYFFNRQN
ncbi:MAG: prepilin-type N-terminal cleavage/methylation domain-containing protein [Candidatus Cloacimonetes bacterium]|nr:prepilin-type N-terminal cleavage/methylation domain-containing protein [Candidatus Cloacimonadota bacterium]